MIAVPAASRATRFVVVPRKVTLEVFHKGERVASHARRDPPGYSTDPAHMPKSHRAHLEWTPSRLIHWGGSIGPHTAALVQAILEERRHPEQGYRSCLGILRLAKQYGPQRLEAASKRAVAVRARSYRHVQSILQHGLDRLPLEEEREAPETPARVHPNVRGGDYYH